MASFHEDLDESLCEFIASQHMFFVATAPEEGRVSLSPKGMNSLHVFNSREVGYLDVTGSGNETAAHVGQNGRLTLMFCSFDRTPLILRLYGTGRTLHPRDAEFEERMQSFEPISGARQIILLSVESIQKSCGYGIPFYEYQGERDTLKKWAEKKGPDGLAEYWEEQNVTSIDGIPTKLLP
jgi:hypothetical protein